MVRRSAARGDERCNVPHYVVNKRFVKKQQMQWTPRGGHLLLQTRTKVLNDDREDTFRRWYPRFRARAA